MLQIREKEIAPNPMSNFYKSTKNNPVQEPDMIFEPDEDFYRSITADEFKEGALKIIDKIFANK